MNRFLLTACLVLVASNGKAAADCDDSKIKSVMLDEFNSAANSKDLPSAVDLMTIQTEIFEKDDQDNPSISCIYEAMLDNGRKQKFRLILKANSMGRPYIRFQPQGSSY